MLGGYRPDVSGNERMNPVLVFAAQFVWFLVVWGAVAVLFVNPRLAGSTRDRVLSVWIAPQLFRVLGLGLLVPNLSPNMPISFAVPTAAGDAATAILALLSLVALQQRWAQARGAAWACTVVGSADLAIALVQAARIGAAQFLAAQWFVPAVMVPLLVVSHVMAFRTLLADGSRWPGSPPN